MYTEEISSFPAVYSGNGVGNIRIYGTAAGLRSIEMIVYNPNYTDYIKDRYDINTDFIYGWDGDVLKFKSNSSTAWDNATVGRAELDSSHWYFQHFENAAVYGRMSYANARYPSNFYNDIYLKGIYWDNIRTQIIAANGGRCFKPENSGSWYLAWSGDMSQERRREWNSPCRLLRDDDFQYCYIGYDGPLYENDYIDLTNRVRVNSDGTQADIKFHFGTSDISLYNGTAIIDFTMTNSLPASGMITKPSKVVIREKGMYMISGKNDGLPCIPDVPDVMPALLTEPVPEYMMRITAGVNDGLPMVIGAGVHTDSDISRLYFADRQVKAMYYGDTEIRSAYCNGKTMFRKYDADS